MERVIAALNAAVEGVATVIVGHNHYAICQDDARIALHMIETQEMAVGALRLILANSGAPKNPALAEALAHGERFLKLHDDYLAKHSPKPVPLAPAKNPEAEQDVSDLV